MLAAKKEHVRAAQMDAAANKPVCKINVK